MPPPPTPQQLWQTDQNGVAALLNQVLTELHRVRESQEAMMERLVKLEGLVDRVEETRRAANDHRGRIDDLNTQVARLETKLSVLWAVAGAAGVAALGSFVTSLYSLIQHAGVAHP